MGGECCCLMMRIKPLARSLSLIGAIGGYTVFCWFVKRLLNDELVSYKNHFSVSNVLEAMGNNADCGGKASVLSHFLCPLRMFLGSFWNSLWLMSEWDLYCGRSFGTKSCKGMETLGIEQLY